MMNPCLYHLPLLINSNSNSNNNNNHHPTMIQNQPNVILLSTFRFWMDDWEWHLCGGEGLIIIKLCCWLCCSVVRRPRWVGWDGAAQFWALSQLCCSVVWREVRLFYRRENLLGKVLRAVVQFCWQVWWRWGWRSRNFCWTFGLDSFGILLCIVIWGWVRMVVVVVRQNVTPVHALIKN